MDTLTLAIFAVLIVITVVGLVGAGFMMFRRSNKDETPSAPPSAPPRTAPPPQATAANTAAPFDFETEPTAPPQRQPQTPTPEPRPQPSPPRPPDDGKIRILIVDDNTGTIENVSRLIYFEDDMTVIGQAHTGKEGLDMAIKHQPHIILMDINMPDMDGITATREITNHAPYSQVVMMSVQSDNQYIRQAMAAGARDFQPKPFTADELVSCIRRVYEIGQPAYAQYDQQARMQAASETEARHIGDTANLSPILLVFSSKGGTGTSAIAANLSVVLQNKLKDVILVDGNLEFGDLRVHLNLNPPRTIADLQVMDTPDPEMVKQVLTRHNSGLAFLSAPESPLNAVAFESEQIAHILQLLQSEARLVMVDMSHVLTNQNLAIIDQASHILLVTTPELPALNSTRHFLRLAYDLGLKPDNFTLVINQANMAGGVPRQQIQRILGFNKAAAIPVDEKLSQALARGVLIAANDPSSPASKAIIALADHLWSRLNKS